MGRMFTLPLTSLSLASADTDLFELGTGSGTVAILHEFKIESAVTSDERLHWILRRASTSGNGSAGTEIPLASLETSTIGVATETIASTPGTDGANLLAGCWSQLAPLHYLPTPEARIVIPVSSFLVLNIVTAPAATRVISGYVIWEEL